MAAEGCIKELKHGSSRKMLKSGSPKRLWDHAIELEALIQSHTAHEIYVLQGQVPETIMTGQTADISNLCEYEWYEWVMYYESLLSYPDNKMFIGRYLGPAIDVGTTVAYKILKANGKYICRPTVCPRTNAEEASPALLAERETFMTQAKEALGPSTTVSDFEDIDLTPDFDYYADDEDGVEGTPDELPTQLLPPTPKVDDNYVGAELMLPRGDSMAQGRVTKRLRDNDGNPVGRANENPILDTREYVVTFDDSMKAELAVNDIAQNMYAQCYPDGKKYVLLDSLIDFRWSTTALGIADQKDTRDDGRTYMRRSTAGWQVCAQWKDGSLSWQKLSDFKESHPVKIAEYAVAQGLEQEPAFNWWVSHVLKKRERIISLVRQREARYLKRNEKFGIAVPRTAKEAYDVDAQNGNTFWADAISKEM